MTQKTEYPMSDDLHAIYSVFSVARDLVEPELKGTNMTLATAEDLKAAGWPNGDEYPITVEWQINKHFGPVVGKIGYVDYNMIQFMVPWVNFGDKKGWTFRPLAITDCLAVALMARVGFRIDTNACALIYWESIDTGFKFFEKTDAFSGEWKAEGEWLTYSDLKKTPIEDFAWATLNQLWTGDRKLKIGGGYVLDPTDMQVRRMTPTSIAITEQSARLGPLLTVKNSLLQMECKTTFKESRPTPIDQLTKPDSEMLTKAVEGVLSLAMRKGEEKKTKSLKSGGDIPDGWFDSSRKPPFQYITLFEKIKERHISTYFQRLTLETDVVDEVQKRITGHRSVSLTGTGYGGTFAELSVPVDGSDLFGTPHLTDIVESKESSMLVKIGAGVTFQDLADKFWPESARKWDGGWDKCKCVIATPGYYYLNYIGVALSGAAGNGGRTPAVHGTIRALDVVYAKETDGKRVATRAWIQPAGGKIPPDLLGDSKAEVIADDDAFQAWVCSFGSLGLVRNAVIELEPAFWLEEERTMHNWREAQPMIRDLLKKSETGGVYNVEVWVSPYLLYVGDKWDDCPVLLSVRTRKTPDHKNTEGKRGFGLTVPLEEAILTGYLSRDSANLTPSLHPAVMHAALCACKQKPVVLTAIESRYFGSENGVPVGVTGNILPVNDKFFDVVSDYIKLLQQRFRECKGLISSPFSLRFSTSSSALLAPQSGTGMRCLLEQPIVTGTNHLDDTLATAEDFLCKNGGGRPHWGLRHHVDKIKLGELYPTENVSKFKAQRTRFSGGVFESSNTRMLFS